MKIHKEAIQAKRPFGILAFFYLLCFICNVFGKNPAQEPTRDLAGDPRAAPAAGAHLSAPSPEK